MAWVAPFVTTDTFPSANMLIQRLLDFGVPAQHLMNKEMGLIQFVRENKTMLQGVISALLPGLEEAEVPELSDAKKTWQQHKRSYKEGIRWAEWLMFEGDPEDKLKSLVMQSGHVKGVCGSVWGRDDIAYRCLTCEKDPTCAICVPCFEAGNHTNHDYTMIHTGGGCCDCGDLTAWNESGFCSRHSGPGQAPTLPEELVSTFEPVMESLLIEWGRRLQEAATVAGKGAKTWHDQSKEERFATQTSLALVETLLKFCNCSESLLTFIGGLMASEKIGLLNIVLISERFLPIKVLNKLHELLFKLMGDPNFKYQFAKVFISHYPRLIHDGWTDELDSHPRSRQRDNPTLSNFSVQIFTVPTLTPQLVFDFGLLDMLLEALKDVFLACKDNDGQLQVSKGPLNHYFRIVDDIRYVLRHPEVAQYVARDRPDLFKAWLYLLAYTQGMDSQRRQTNIHVEEESENWYAPYLLEIQMATIHPLIIDGAAKAANFTSKDADRRTDISCRESLEGEDAVHGHAKIGRITKESDGSGKVGTSDVLSQVDVESSDESVSNKCAAASPITNVPTTLFWLISECCRVLEIWLLLNYYRAAKSEWLHLQRGGTPQRISMLLLGRGGRGLIRDPHGFSLDDGSGQVHNAEMISSHTISFREWLSTNQYNEARRSQDMTRNRPEDTQLRHNAKDSPDYWWMGLEVPEPGSSPGFTWTDNEWLEIDFDVSQREVSLHIPLHRFLAVALQKSLEISPDIVYQENAKNSWHADGHSTVDKNFLLQLFPAHYRVPGFASVLMEHPLRIQVFVAQYRAGMWRRNGQSVQALCENYLSVRWCEESSDLDLFLLQCCAVMSPPEHFVDRIVSRFGLTDYFSLFLLRPNEYETTLTQHMLSFLIRIVVERGFCGFSVAQACRRELIKRLAISDATHSQLMKSLPSRLHDYIKWQDILFDIANYYKPSGMQQGRFSLREEFWKELDLYHPRWNARELQSAEDRYLNASKASALIKQLPQWRKPFPPFMNLAKIATCEKVHDIIRSILFHAVFSEKISESRAPETVLFTALHLLALGLDLCSLFTYNKNVPYLQSDSSIEPVPSSSWQGLERPPPLIGKATERVYFGGADGAEISNRQNLISLLVLLMQKYSKAEALGGGDTHPQCNIGTLVKSLLHKFADLHNACMYEIESLAPEILHRVSKQQNSKGSDKEQPSEAERRKILARERQAAVMAKMKAAQEKFASTMRSSQEGHDEDGRGPQSRSAHEAKTDKDSSSQSEQCQHSPSSVACSLCRDCNSDSPMSLLTFVQRSRLLAISVKGIPSWDKAPEQENSKVSSLNRELERRGSAPTDSARHESEILRALNGETEQGGVIEVETLMQLLGDEEYTDSFDSTQSSNDARMSETSSSDSGDDEIGEGENTFASDDSPQTLSGYLPHGHEESGTFEDENDKNRHSCLTNTVLEYASVLSRIRKHEQQQETENSIDSAGSLQGPNRQQYSRSSSVEGLPMDNLASNDNIGVHMSSCGHAVHKDCLDRYISSLLHRFRNRTLFEGLQIVDPDLGEFLCPVCRRLANSVVPYLPENMVGPCPRKEAATGATNVLPEYPKSSASLFYLPYALYLLHNVEESQWKPGSSKSTVKQIPKILKPVFDALFSRLCSLYFPNKGSSSKSDRCRVSQSLLLWDVLRYTIMSTELASRGMTKDYINFNAVLCKAVEKGHVLPLMIRAAKSLQDQNRQTLLLRARGIQLLVCSLCFGVSKDSLTEPFMPGSVLKILSLIDNGREAADIQFWKRTADPVLAHDPFSSVLWLVFCLPPPYSSSKEAFISLVHLLYLACLLQIILLMGESLLSNISELQLSSPASSFLERILTVFSNIPVFSRYDDLAMSSSGSVVVTIRRFSLPYLRRCAFLEKVYFETSSEEMEAHEISEYDALAAKMTAVDKLSTESMPDAFEDLKQFEFLEQKFSLPSMEIIFQNEQTQEVALRWCQHLCKEYGSRNLQPIPRVVTAAPFKLMSLPRLYQSLLQRYIKERCPECSTIPEQPALCLLCGKLCCGTARKACCSENGKSECYRHALACGGGVGVYLMIRKTNILLQRCARQATWPSPYLDAYGEEDIDMQRGKPLHLSEERYAALTAIVVSHGLDHSSHVLSHTTWETLIWG